VFADEFAGVGESGFPLYLMSPWKFLEAAKVSLMLMGDLDLDSGGASLRLRHLQSNQNSWMTVVLSLKGFVV